MARTKQTGRRPMGMVIRPKNPIRSYPFYGRQEEELSEDKREIERLKQELAKYRELHGDEDDVFARKRKRPSESEAEGTVARLPTEVWTIIAKMVRKNDVLAFALTSKQHREAQQQAGRKLVTRLLVHYQEANEDDVCENFSRDWCVWWSRRFNMTETAPKCMNRVIQVAAHHGYFDVLKTYWSNIPKDKIPLLMDDLTFAKTASKGHLEILQWLRSQGCAWNSYTCGWAAAYGHLKCVQWLRSEGCPWNALTCLWAVQRGQLECLQWARENGCPWYANQMCDLAAMNGHLPVLKWVREQGCPWGETTTLKAAIWGHLKCFRWLIYSGCPWNRESCRSKGNANIKQWMREQEDLE